EMYLEGSHFDLAARLAEEMGDLSSASLYYLKAGDLRTAGEMEFRQGNKEKAAWMFSRGGEHTRAAELLEELGKFEDAAQQYDKGGFAEKAAMLYVQAERHMTAALMFERLIASGSEETGSYKSDAERANLTRYHRFCGELFTRAGLPVRAAPHFEAALLPDQAAEAGRGAGQAPPPADQ